MKFKISERRLRERLALSLLMLGLLMPANLQAKPSVGRTLRSRAQNLLASIKQRHRLGAHLRASAKEAKAARHLARTMTLIEKGTRLDLDEGLASKSRTIPYERAQRRWLQSRQARRWTEAKLELGDEPLFKRVYREENKRQKVAYDEWFSVVSMSAGFSSIGLVAAAGISASIDRADIPYRRGRIVSEE